MSKCASCGEACTNCGLHPMTLRELLTVVFLTFLVPAFVIYYGGSIINERNYLRQQNAEYEALLKAARRVDGGAP